MSNNEIPSDPVPPGAPAWVTPELIASTIRVWQPFYAEPLTTIDALNMILNVAQLCAVLREGSNDQANRSAV